MWQLKFVVLGLLSLLVGLIVLYRKSRTFRFRTKYFSYNCLMMFYAMYCGIVGVFHPFDVENFHRCAGFVYKSLVRLFSIRCDVQGLEVFNTLKGKNFIIVANHQSSLDMFPILQATPHRTTFVAKKELLFAPLFGFAAWLFGVVFINRGHSKSARNVMDKTVKWISDQKTGVKMSGFGGSGYFAREIISTTIFARAFGSHQINLWIFPEGTRSQTGTLLPFKKGAFHLAQQAQFPIVPIVIFDYSSIFNKKNKLFEYGTIKAKVLDPISIEGIAADEVAEFAENVRQQMLKVFLGEDPSKIKRDMNAVSTEDKKSK